MNDILHRISLIVDSQNITITKLETVIGASAGVLSRALRNSTDIQTKWLLKIIENYPQINSEWLLTGKGEMYKNADSRHEVPASSSADLVETQKKLITLLENRIDELEKSLKIKEAEKKSYQHS